MKNLTFLKRVLWLLIPLLTMFNSRMYADAFEGFENFSTSTSYTSQLDWSNAKADLDWQSRYGAVTTSSKRSGSNGFLLRNYKNSGNKGWLVTRTTLQNVTSITYYKKVTNTGVQHKVCYSTDGSNWTNITTGITGSTSWGSQTITVPAAVRASALYFRWEITSTNTKGSNRDLYIDDITFTVDAGSVATPSFNNGTGTYNNDVSVTISCATAGATIHYRTDGTVPTCSTGTTGTSVTISSTGTVLKAIACKDGSTDSEVATATYTLKCATPTGLSTDTYVGTQTVTLATITEGANIYYTTNGSTPTSSSTLYTTPFSVSSTTTIKAIAIKSNYANSDVASATYTITPAYVVTWKNQGTTVTTTNVASGSKPVFPDMSGESGCQKYTYFYGWAEDTWTGEVASPGTSSTVKVYKSASEMPDVTGNVTYHAVWGDSPGGWSIVSSIAVDDVVVFAYTNGSSYYKELSGVSNSMGQVSDYSSTPSGLYPLTVCAGTASGYFAFKNGSNYLKGTTSNSLETETSVTDASSWSVSITNGVAEIENKANSGRKLKGNTSQYRIVNYNNNNANNINIWKQSASANCVTSCCNQLAAINGSVSSYTQTSVTLQWDKLSNVDGTTPYTVTCSPAGTVGSIDLSGAKATCTVTGLSCGTAYTFSITAHGTTGYCDKTQSGIAQTTSSYTVGYSVTNGSKTSGDATTCGPLTAVFSANSGYHLPDKAAITVTGASDFSWTKATGTLTITAGQITGNINISFTCPADACTDAFSLHTGTKGGSDWLHNKCFSDADWGAVDDAIWVGEFPSTNECYVGYAGGDSYHGAYWAVGGIKTYNIPNGRTLGWNGSDYYSDYPATALGTFHIYKNSTDANYYLRFKPTTYVLRTGANSTWTSRDMTVSGINSNYYESDFVTLTSTLISEHAYVDLKANNGDGHVWCNFSNDRTASGNVKVKNGASTFRATDLQASDNGTYGKFQIDITQDVDNWKLAFVPYFHITYNANGGTGSTAASSYVEVGSTAAAAANGFTAPTGKQFGGWATSADGSKAYDPTDAVTLNSNVELFAVWTDINYTVTVNQNPSVGATTTGQTTTAHYNGTINLTTTIPDGYRFVNWTTSDGFSITNPTSATTASFTMPAKNVTVTANFQQTHTVTWLSNGSNYVSPVTYDHGGTLALPAGTPSTPGGCSSKVFVGWAETNEITVATSTAPTFLDAGSLGTVTADKTYRAVFADEDDDEVTYSYGWEADPSSADWEVSNISRSNTSADVKTGSYGGHVQTSSGAYIKLKHQISPTSVSCYYTKTSTNTNQSSSFALEYWVDDGGSGYWDGLALGLTMNSVTQGTWYELSWSGSDKTDTYVRVVYSGTNAPRALDDLVIVAGGTTYDNYITLCSSCTTPSTLEVSSITSTGGTVTWDGVSLSPTEGFKVAWNTSNSVPSPLTASNSADVAAGTNSYAITGLTPATRYYVFVKSKCNDTWSSSTNFYTNAKITYAAGTGASGSMDPKEVTYNTNVTVDACTFTAPSGKKFNGWVSDQAVTVSASSTTSVPDGATITNLTKAITLTAQWRDLASYTVNFSADNGTVAGGTSTTVYEDGTLTFPNVTSTTCGTFQGWVEAAYDNTAKPSGATFHEAGDVIDVTDALNDKTYYAVYAEVTDPTPTSDYVKVECEQTDWEGDYLIVSEYTISSTDYVKVFNGGLETLDASGNCVADVTITSKTITSNNTTDGYKFTISAVAGQAGKFYIKSVGYSKYIGNSGTGNALSSSTEASSTYYNTIEYDATNSRVLIKGNNASPTRLAYNSATGASSNRFRYYSAPDSQKDIQLYKKGGAETVNYNTSPSCSPTVALTCSFSTFTYVYNAGPSASQTFMVSGSNLGANTMTVTAPTNYEVSKDNSTFSSSVSYTPSDGSVAASTVYIRLAAGLSVGTYNYAQASGLVVACAGAGATAQKAALNGSVTKATGSIAFTDFNAGDHYEAEWTGSAILVPYNYILTGDGTLTTTRVDGRGGAVDTETKKWSLTNEGTYTLRLTLAAGANYTGAGPVTADFVIYKADRFYDNLHGNSTIVKRNDAGEDHYTIPTLTDESRLTSGSCSETHYHFMGWVPESALSTLSNDAAYDAVMITGGGTQAASGTNYYAVWAEE